LHTVEKNIPRKVVLLEKVKNNKMELIGSSTLTGFATDLGANVTSAIDSVWVVALLAVSIPLAFYVIRRVIALFRG